MPRVLSPQAPYARYGLSLALSRSLARLRIAASDLIPSPNSHERGLTPTFATVPRRLCQHGQGLGELLVSLVPPLLSISDALYLGSRAV